MASMPLAGTLSIVAVDKRAHEMGAAVVSQSFSAGSQTIWVEPGVGAVVAQATVDPTYGPLGLALLKGGKTPAHALKSLMATDPRPGVRQVMLVDSRGRAAAHTGKACLPEAGFLAGRGFCVQAGFVNAKRVWRAMASRFRAEKGPLEWRLLEALEAGESASKGPKRGGPAVSAALVLVSSLPTNTPWEGRLLDLRVESSEYPLKELKRMLRLREAYAHASAAREMVSKGDVGKINKEFSRAVSLAPTSSELKLLYALSLLQTGETRRGASLLRSALGRGQDAKAVLKELSARGILGPGQAKPVEGKGR